MRSLSFLYHELRAAESRYSYVVSERDFEAHCGLYARLLGAPENEARLRPEITFDDGHRSDLTIASPCLLRHGLRGSFFITAGWTGQRAAYMSWAELRELHAAGHRIGAHGMQHRLLTGCSGAEMEEELGAARRRLEDGLGCEVRTMSLPGGRADARVFRACREAGYAQVFTSVPRAEPVSPEPAVAGRLNLLGGTSVAWLERVLDPASGLLLSLERKDRLKSAAKRVLGDRLYARVWALGNRQEAEGADVADVVDLEAPVS